MSHLIKSPVMALAPVMAAAPVVHAERVFTTRATVVSVDTKTRTMTLRTLTEGATEKPEEYVLRWDEKTEFVKEGATWADEPIKIALTDVKPCARVYVRISDRFFNFPGQKNDTLWLQMLRLLRPAP